MQDFQRIVDAVRDADLAPLVTACGHRKSFGVDSHVESAAERREEFRERVSLEVDVAVRPQVVVRIRDATAHQSPVFERRRFVRCEHEPFARRTVHDLDTAPQQRRFECRARGIRPNVELRAQHPDIAGRSANHERVILVVSDVEHGFARDADRTLAAREHGGALQRSARIEPHRRAVPERITHRSVLSRQHRFLTPERREVMRGREMNGSRTQHDGGRRRGTPAQQTATAAHTHTARGIKVVEAGVQKRQRF